MGDVRCFLCNEPALETEVTCTPCIAYCARKTAETLQRVRRLNEPVEDAAREVAQSYEPKEVRHVPVLIPVVDAMVLLHVLEREHRRPEVVGSERSATRKRTLERLYLCVRRTLEEY